VKNSNIAAYLTMWHSRRKFASGHCVSHRHAFKFPSPLLRNTQCHWMIK